VLSPLPPLTLLLLLLLLSALTPVPPPLLKFAFLTASETAEAFDKVREFQRLKVCESVCVQSHLQTHLEALEVEVMLSNAAV